MPTVDKLQTGGLPHVNNKKVKLTEEELTKSLQRLYEAPCEKRRNKYEGDKKEIEENSKKNGVKSRAPGKEFKPSERLAAQCQRLYETPLIQQKNTIQQLEQKYASQLEASRPVRVKLTDERHDETVHRLYAVSVESKKTIREQMEKKVYGEAPPCPKLDSETLKENVSSLYSKVC